MCSQKYYTATTERLCPCLSTADTSLPLLAAVRVMCRKQSHKHYHVVSSSHSDYKDHPVPPCRRRVFRPQGKWKQHHGEVKLLFLGLSDLSAQVLNCRSNLPEARYPNSTYKNWGTESTVLSACWLRGLDMILD